VAIEIKVVSGGEQLERWVAVHNEIRPDDPESTSTKALVRAEEREHLDLLAFVDGEPVGTAMVGGDAQSETSGRPWIELNVLPAYRGRGVGAALFREVSEHARRRGQIGFSCEARADDAHSLSFLERRGFVASRRWHQFVLELDDRVGGETALPEGIELASIADRPALLGGMYQVAAATYSELDGYRAKQAESFVTWQVYELGTSSALLELTPLAIADEDVIGFATMRTLIDETIGELRTVAVLPEWRSRGVASALIGAQVTGAKDAGLRRLSTWVAAGRAAGLYRRLGFEQVAGFVEFEGPLLGGLGETTSVSPGCAGRPEASSSVAPV
jgi:mycothiol synthase